MTLETAPQAIAPCYADLLAFAEMVARLTSELDMEEAGDDDGMSGDDACETVNSLIDHARSLVKGR